MIYYGLELRSLDTYFQAKEITAPSTPQPNELRWYVKDSGGISTLCYKNDAGTEICLPTSGAIVTGTGAAGQVAFFSSASVISGEDNLFWNATDNRLGVLTAVPLQPLDVRGNVRFGATPGFLYTDSTQTTLIQGLGANVVLDVRGTTNNLLNISETGTTALYKFGATGSTNAFLSCGDNFIIQIDSNNDQTDQVFLIKHDAISTGGTSLFEVNENGVTTATSVLNATVGYRIAGLAASGNLLIGNGTNFVSTAQSGIDHGSLGGLSDDDHAQYALLAGRSGGQTLKGGTGVTDVLNLQSTSGVGTTDKIRFLVGNNGATEAFFVADGGYLVFTSDPTTANAIGIRRNMTTAKSRLISIDASTYTGDGSTEPSALFVESTYIPTTNLSSAKNTFFTGKGDPGTGVTITSVFGLFNRADTGNGVGAITNLVGMITETPIFGTLKPTNSYGIKVGNQGATGITTSIALSLALPTNSTNNYYMEFGTADNTDPTGGGGAAVGRIPVIIGGTLRYVAYY